MEHKRTFRNTRARFQRLRDAKLFSGWIRNFNGPTVVLTLARAAELQPGDEFMFQVFGHGTMAMFRAELSLQAGDQLTFQVIGPTQYRRSKEDMRLLADGITGVLTCDGFDIDVIFVDLSVKGAGVICGQQLTKGSAIELRIDSSQGPILCTGEVVYSKRMSLNDFQFRVGLSVTPRGRIDLARWQRLLLTDAAA